MHLKLKVGGSEAHIKKWHPAALQTKPSEVEIITAFYHQVGDIRATHKGRKVWNLPETENGLRAARFGIGAAPTLGSMFLPRVSTNLQPAIDLTNAFKSFFRDDSFKLCSKIAGTLGKQGAKGRKVWNLPQPLPESVLRAAGKSLAQGQVALTDRT